MVAGGHALFNRNSEAVLLGHLSKPWFVYRPSQLARRVLGQTAAATPGLQPLNTAWGATIEADPTRTIGHSILTTGVFDLAVSETIARLVDAGGTIVDAGANVGYMTVLAATAAGPTGRVIAFEPHPELFAVLERNVRRLTGRGSSMAGVALHNHALGDRDGPATLVIPSDFASNDGTARVARDDSGETGVPVPICTLDKVVGASRVDLLKIDVEGFEPQVLRGAARALAQRRVRHVVFEDHAVALSDAVGLLRDAGYTLFALGWALRRLTLEPLSAGPLAHAYEAPSFIATLEPDLVIARCRPPGWRVLQRHLGG